MKLLNFVNFNLPFALHRSQPNSQPPQKKLETRRVADALSHPQFTVYDPSSLHYPDHMVPVVPGDGGYVTCGLGMVTYDHQATWDRTALEIAGPVRATFRKWMNDNRVKHI